MYLLTYLLVYNCLLHYKIADIDKPIAIIPLAFNEYHLTKENKTYKLVKNENALYKTSIKLIQKSNTFNNNSLIIQFGYDNTFLGFKEDGNLIECVLPTSSNIYWDIRKSLNDEGYLIVSVNSKDKQYCLAVEDTESVNIEECNLNRLKQRFLIEDFNEITKIKPENMESRTTSSYNPGTDNISLTRKCILNKTVYIDPNNKNDIEKMELNEELEKLKTKMMEKLNNQQDKGRYIADSFGVEPAHNQKSADTKPDVGLENIFGVSEDPNSVFYNPIKAAALKIYMGVDKYLAKKYEPPNSDPLSIKKDGEKKGEKNEADKKDTDAE